MATLSYSGFAVTTRLPYRLFSVHLSGLCILCVSAAALVFSARVCGFDKLQPTLRWRGHFSTTSLSGVASRPKLPSTAGMSEPQPAALFPLWDLLSYFFRLWFGERNQHINDFFFPKSH